MYTPSQLREERLPVLHSLITEHPFGALVTCGEQGPTAEHIPFVLHSDESDNGTLRGHVGRHNPLAQQINDGVPTLVIFQGPQTYITPTWYPSKAEHGKVVPTWNYALVHAYGKLSFVHDEIWLREHLESLTLSQEADQRIPWKPDDAPATFLNRQITGIVGVEIKIDRFEGKWKVSQNKGPSDRNGVVDGLRAVDTDETNAMAKLVEGGQ